MSQELRNNMLVEINKFRVALQELKRTPTVDDVVILQANLADALFALIEKDCKQPELLTGLEILILLNEHVASGSDSRIEFGLKVAQAQLDKKAL